MTGCAGELHAELQRRLCTNSAHDRVVASLAASACAAGRRESGQPAELPAAFVEHVMLMLQRAKFASPDPGTFAPMPASLRIALQWLVEVDP
jgi:hypothetical protein